MAERQNTLAVTGNSASMIDKTSHIISSGPKGHYKKKQEVKKESPVIRLRGLTTSVVRSLSQKKSTEWKPQVLSAIKSEIDAEHAVQTKQSLIIPDKLRGHPEFEFETSKRQIKLLLLAQSIQAFKEEKQKIFELSGKKLQVEDGQSQLLFDEFPEALGDFPFALRNDLYELCEIVNYHSNYEVTSGFDEEVENPESRSHDIHLIIKGAAVQIKNEATYRQHLGSEQRRRDDMKRKASLVTSDEISGIARVGWIFLQHLKKDKKLTAYLKQKQEQYEMEQMSFEMQEMSQKELLQAGSYFGDLTVANKKFKPCWTIVKSQSIKCIRIKQQDLQQLLTRVHSIDNVRLLEDSLSPSKASAKVLRNISNSFSERTYPADTILILENTPLQYIYFLKEGTCELTSSDSHPLVGHNRVNPFTKLKATGGNVALGLDQGQMSMQFNQYHIAYLEQNSWLGQDAIFNPQHTLHYTVRTKTECKLICIGFDNFKDKSNKNLQEFLEQQSILRQKFIAKRQLQISNMAGNVYEKQKFYQFYQNSVKNLLELHPQANAKIIKNISHRQALKGQISLAREKDKYTEIYDMDSCLLDSKNRQTNIDSPSKEIVPTPQFSASLMVSPQKSGQNSPDISQMSGLKKNSRNFSMETTAYNQAFQTPGPKTDLNPPDYAKDMHKTQLPNVVPQKSDYLNKSIDSNKMRKTVQFSFQANATARINQSLQRQQKYLNQSVPIENKFNRSMNEQEIDEFLQEQRKLAYTELTEEAQKERQANLPQVHPLQQLRNETVDKFVVIDNRKYNFFEMTNSIKERQTNYFNKSLDLQSREMDQTIVHTYFGINQPLPIAASIKTRTNKSLEPIVGKAKKGADVSMKMAVTLQPQRASKRQMEGLRVQKYNDHSHRAHIHNINLQSEERARMPEAEFDDYDDEFSRDEFRLKPNLINSQKKNRSGVQSISEDHALMDLIDQETKDLDSHRGKQDQRTFFQKKNFPGAELLNAEDMWGFDKNVKMSAGSSGPQANDMESQQWLETAFDSMSRELNSIWSQKELEEKGVDIGGKSLKHRSVYQTQKNISNDMQAVEGLYRLKPKKELTNRAQYDRLRKTGMAMAVPARASQANQTNNQQYYNFRYSSDKARETLSKEAFNTTKSVVKAANAKDSNYDTNAFRISTMDLQNKPHLVDENGQLKAEQKYRSGGHLSPSLGFKTATNTFLVKPNVLKSMNEQSGQALPEVGTAQSKDSQTNIEDKNIIKSNKPTAHGLVTTKWVKNKQDQNLIRGQIQTATRINGNQVDSSFNQKVVVTRNNDLITTKQINSSVGIPGNENYSPFNNSPVKRPLQMQAVNSVIKKNNQVSAIGQGFSAQAQSAQKNNLDIEDQESKEFRNDLSARYESRLHSQSKGAQNANNSVQAQIEAEENKKNNNLKKKQKKTKDAKPIEQVDIDYGMLQKVTQNSIELGTGVDKYFTSNNSATGQITGENVHNSRIPTVTGVRIKADERQTPLEIAKDGETPERRHLSRQSVPIQSNESQEKQSKKQTT